MDKVLAAGMFALVVGWVLGWSGERARRSRSDYRKMKATVGGLRKTAWANFRTAAARITIVAVLLGAAIFGYLSNPQQ